MNDADKRTRNIALIVGAIIGLIITALLLFTPLKCSAQETITESVTISKGAVKAMYDQHGEGWQKRVQSVMRNAARQEVDVAKEAYKTRWSGILFDVDAMDVLTTQERNAVKRAQDSAAARLLVIQLAKDAEQKRLADSVAAARATGSLITPSEQQPARYATNVGKALSSRTLFMQDLAEPGTTGGGGGAPPPLAHGYITAPQLAVVLAVLVVGAVAVIAAGYGVYHLVKWAVKR